MTPYDLPDEFVALQSQDVSKVGYMQDLMRGIEKILGNGAEKTVVKETVVTSGNTNTAPLLKRTFLFLEDGDWSNANIYCEKVLDIEPECAQAYFGKLLAELHINKEENLPNVKQDVSAFDNYQKACRFGNIEFRNKLENYNKQAIYNQLVAAMQIAQSYLDYQTILKNFEGISDYKDSNDKIKECFEKAETIKKREEQELSRKKSIYQSAMQYQSKNKINYIKKAIKNYESILEYEDSPEQIQKCSMKISDIKLKRKIKYILIFILLLFFDNLLFMNSGSVSYESPGLRIISYSPVYGLIALILAFLISCLIVFSLKIKRKLTKVLIILLPPLVQYIGLMLLMGI